MQGGVRKNKKKEKSFYPCVMAQQ